MALPELVGWDATRDALHQATQVIGAIRVAMVEPLSNDLQYSVKIIANGISSDKLKNGGELVLDFATGILGYKQDYQLLFAIDISSYNQTSLMTAVLDQLKQVGINVEPSWNKIKATSPFQVDKAISADYAQVLNNVFVAMELFRARLSG